MLAGGTRECMVRPTNVCDNSDPARGRSDNRTRCHRNVRAMKRLCLSCSDLAFPASSNHRAQS